MAGTAIGPKHFRCTPWLMEVFRALTTSGAKMFAGFSAMNERPCAKFHEVCARRHIQRQKASTISSRFRECEFAVKYSAANLLDLW